jgi:hypothetical protein
MPLRFSLNRRSERDDIKEWGSDVVGFEMIVDALR